MKHETKSDLVKHLTYKIINRLGIIFIFLFLIFNLLSSQLISPLYYKLMESDTDAVLPFLKKIKKSSAFPSYFEMNKRIFGKRIEQEVFAEDEKRKEKIQNLESLLEENPKARDVLYNLYLLYTQEDNAKKAKEYLEKAREIDPMLEN